MLKRKTAVVVLLTVVWTINWAVIVTDVRFVYSDGAVAHVVLVCDQFCFIYIQRMQDW